MKDRMFHRHVITSVLTAAALIPLTALAEYKCANPQQRIDQRACEKAAEGPNALRKFVERTRMIWQLDIWDYSKPELLRAASEDTFMTALAVQSGKAEPAREAAPTP